MARISAVYQLVCETVVSTCDICDKETAKDLVGLGPTWTPVEGDIKISSIGTEMYSTPSLIQYVHCQPSLESALVSGRLAVQSFTAAMGLRSGHLSEACGPSETFQKNWGGSQIARRSERLLRPWSGAVQRVEVPRGVHSVFDGRGRRALTTFFANGVIAPQTFPYLSPATLARGRQHTALQGTPTLVLYVQSTSHLAISEERNFLGRCLY
jgi:hypothetical protein